MTDTLTIIELDVDLEKEVPCELAAECNQVATLLTKWTCPNCGRICYTACAPDLKRLLVGSVMRNDYQHRACGSKRVSFLESVAL